VGLAAQLVQAVQLRVSGAEIAQEVASRATVVTRRVGTERGAEGTGRAVFRRRIV